MRLLVLVFMAAGALLAQDGRGWLNQGVSEFKSGDYPQAVADFQKAVDSDPSNTTFRLYLATAWMQQYVPGVGYAGQSWAGVFRVFLTKLCRSTIRSLATQKISRPILPPVRPLRPSHRPSPRLRQYGMPSGQPNSTF